MELIVGLFIFAVSVAIYFLPGIVASNREHASAGGIWVLNIFLGWTLLGWVVALAWACANSPAPAQSRSPANTPSRAPALNHDAAAESLRRLHQLKSEGLITEDDFEAKKREILGLG